MLEEALKCESYLLRGLDPSRCEDAEWRFCPDWFRASDTDVAFGHAEISPHFLHGTTKTLDSTIEDLVYGRTNSATIAALVAVRRKGSNKKFVICGNRRLKCYKEALRKGHDCWFKMIVHDFPECAKIENRAERYAFRLKAIEAMSTENDGQDARVRKRRRVP
eukprot:Skav236253  [mRNA]  locus=scaffold829:401583:402071:- [translate_table: standard]